MGQSARGSAIARADLSSNLRIIFGPAWFSMARLQAVMPPLQRLFGKTCCQPLVEIFVSTGLPQRILVDFPNAELMTVISGDRNQAFR